jgi:hypothetical protein
MVWRSITRVSRPVIPECRAVGVFVEIPMISARNLDRVAKIAQLCKCNIPWLDLNRSLLLGKFTDLCAGLAHVFPTMLEFPSFVSATSHIYVWVCMLVLRRATLAVAEHTPYPLVRKRCQKVTLTASANECAINLCQSVAYLGRPEHVSCAILACFGPLYFAAEWFEQHHAVQRLA